MNFIFISKKYILLFIFTMCIFFTVCFVYINSKKDSSCSSDYIVSVSADDDSSFSDLQSKIDSIYSSKEKVAFLTFDDGPTKIATPKVLDILKENDVNASFFVIGYRVKEFPNIVKRAYEEGNFIANHGYSHKNSKLYKSKDSFINEILDTDKAISDAIEVSNYHSHVFRFPNGSKGGHSSNIKSNCKTYLNDIGYCYVDWNALNNDSIKKYSSSQLLDNLKKTCKNKTSLIVLMHDTCDVSKSYTALDASIKYLKEEGYSFKNFDSILNTQ